jgi:hypothetical protein
MADEKKKKLSKEEIEAIKKVEEAVVPKIREEEKVQIKDLAKEVEKDLKNTKENLKAQTNEALGDKKDLKPSDLKDNLKKEIKKVENETKKELDQAKEAAKELKEEVKTTTKEIEEKVQEIKEDVKEKTEKTKEKATQKLEEIDKEEKKIQEIKEEIEEKVQEEIQEEKAPKKEIKPRGAKNKNKLAKSKIQEAKQKVQEIEKEVEEAVEQVKAKIAEFEEYEANVLNSVIAKAKKRLKEIGFEEPEDTVVLAKAEIEPKKDEQPLSINDISTGAGSAFIFGLVGGLATVAGWCIYASKLQGVPFPPHKIPNLEELTQKAATIASGLGLEADPTIGAGIVGGSALVVFLIIYKMIISMKASKNLEISKKLEADANEYSKKKLKFKEMVLKIGEHVDELRATTEKFEALLDEKSASLKRAKVFENPEHFDDLNPKTKDTAKDTHDLVVGLEKLLAAPMAKDAVLNEESIEALNKANNLINKQVEKIYN